MGDWESSIEPIFEVWQGRKPAVTVAGQTLESVAYAPMRLIMECVMFLVHDMHD